MNLKVGRNDPCPCGSGKKYKQCCLTKDKETKGLPGIKKKFTAKLLSQPKQIDLMERTFGSAIETIEKQQQHIVEPELRNVAEEKVVNESDVQEPKT